MSTKWGKVDYLNNLGSRMRYGVPWHLLDLCNIPGIGQAKAMKLAKVKIDTPAKVISSPAMVRAALHCSEKVLEKIIEAARKLV
jgi:replicative superfamily II helicase